MFNASFFINQCRNLPTKGRLDILRQKKELEQTIKEIIQVRKDQIKKGQSETYGSELLGLMILAADEDTSLTGENAHFDLQSLIDECKTFYLAGHDTTSTLLTWTMMLLGTHTEWQDRARAEVFEVCGDQPPNADTVGKLKVVRVLPILPGLINFCNFNILGLSEKVRWSPFIHHL